ncbi:MAG: hypothetical protein A2096_09385 [Spirochaetes bacterium GWF1_41_5]|nr:MAG: hypothetical protein A2096_09385 [Spirochaetes bacterium GWF1_41_5]
MADEDKSIYCANCLYCIVQQKNALVKDQYVLRVNCSQNKWKKKMGEQKLYKYFTVARRTVDECDIFTPMGDNEKEYIKELRKNLPIKDEVYVVK